MLGGSTFRLSFQSHFLTIITDPQEKSILRESCQMGPEEGGSMVLGSVVLGSLCGERKASSFRASEGIFPCLGYSFRTHLHFGVDHRRAFA